MIVITQEMVNDFLAQRTLAVVGVSRRSDKFGNKAYRELLEKGYNVYIVHPSGETIEGTQSYKSLSDLPERVGGIVVVVPPEQAIKVVQEAYALGINQVWLQPGAESPQIIDYAEQKGMSLVHDMCILMLAEPQNLIHKSHKWFIKLIGRMPK